jgi:predicted nucleic acid-binding Zn ribbon protein
MRRLCLKCDNPRQPRADAKFCSDACRHAHWRKRVRLERVLAQRRRCAICRKALALTMRADAKVCSARCRQRAYYRRRNAAAPAAKAHQRVIRERLAAASEPPPALDIGEASVRPITLAEASAVIEQYEYLGTMPAVARHAFGIFFEERLGGVAVYGDEYGENLGVWDRYDTAARSSACCAARACIGRIRTARAS